MNTSYTKNLLLILALIFVISSCNILETIPVADVNQTKISEDSESHSQNRFYRFNAKEKFGDVSPATIIIDKIQISRTRSYIQRKVKTSQKELTIVTKYTGILKTLKWLGLIAVVLMAALGFFTIKPSFDKTIKRKNLVRIIIAQIPLILFLIFVEYPFLFLFLWFAVIVICLIVFTSSEFKRKHLYVVAIAIVLFAYFGIKAGSWVYIDNAFNETVSISINGKVIGELEGKSFTKIRVSAINHTIEIRANRETLEKVNLAMDKPFNRVLQQAFYPWGKYIYNVGAANEYQLKTVRYY